MNKVLLTILTLISINSFGQQWSEYQVDSTLTLMLPDNYEVRDTLEQRVVTSRVDNGIIIISILPNGGQTAINVQSEQELIKSYKDMRQGIINSQSGQLIKEEIIENRGLKMIRFSYTATMGEERQIRHCVVVFINEKTYSINFWQVESLTNEMADTREKLFSSLKFPTNPGLNNQMSYSIEGSRSYNIGYLVGKILGYGLMIGLLVMLIRWISKRAKRKSTNAQQ